MRRHYNIIVKGKVHGVNYRSTTHAEALKLGLTGYVKNLANGDVYIEAEGEENAINKLIEWCHIGPPRAKVLEVKANEDSVKGYRNFELRRL
jgi:acylphosphatase